MEKGLMHMIDMKGWISAHKPVAIVAGVAIVAVIGVGGFFGVRTAVRVAANEAIQPSLTSTQIDDEHSMSTWDLSADAGSVIEGDEDSRASDDGGLTKVADNYYRLVDWSKYAEVVSGKSQQIEWQGQLYNRSGSRESTDGTEEELRAWATQGGAIAFELTHDDGSYTIVRYSVMGSLDAL